MSQSKRIPFIAGNWKMNLDRKSAIENVTTLRRFAEGLKGAPIQIAVFPPSVYLAELASSLKATPVRVGAQNFYFAEKGAFTGEISTGMIKDIGSDLVLIGHSERRHVFGESDEWIAKKVRAALQANLDLVLCVGEKLEERESGKTASVIERQIRSGLAGVTEKEMEKVTIAYEPVWAIGTGKNATAAQAGEVHKQIRELLATLYGKPVAECIRIQYGGSVTAENAAELFRETEIDGFLVGGASLDAGKFQKILEAGCARSAV